MKSRYTQIPMLFAASFSALTHFSAAQANDFDAICGRFERSTLAAREECTRKYKGYPTDREACVREDVQPKQDVWTACIRSINLYGAKKTKEKIDAGKLMEP
jgi:hypothetical protein